MWFTELQPAHPYLLTVTQTKLTDIDYKSSARARKDADSDLDSDYEL